MKKISSLISVAIAIISFFSLIALIGSYLWVQLDLTAGYDSAKIVNYSPYGDPETSEEIQANVKKSFSESGLFLRMASGNVGKTETRTIVLFILLSLIGSVSGLVYSNKIAAEAARAQERTRKSNEFH